MTEGEKNLIKGMNNLYETMITEELEKKSKKQDLFISNLYERLLQLETIGNDCP